MDGSVLIACDRIAPGGGPPGYSYNLLKALREVTAAESSTLEIRTLVQPSIARNRYTSTGQSASSVHMPSFAATTVGVPVLRLASGLKSRISPHGRASLEAFASADLVLFQGYQHSYRLRRARSKGAVTLYMPHSPAPQYVEYSGLSRLEGVHSIVRERYLLHDEARLLAEADLIVFASPGSATNYAEAFDLDLADPRIRFLHSGVPDLNVNVDGIGGRSNDVHPIVTFAGRYVPHKGYDLFLEAAETLKREGLAATFQTIGDGPLRRDSAAVSNLGWTDHPAPVLASSDVVVIPNRIGYYDLLPLEVASLSRPMVLSDAGGGADQLALLPDTVAFGAEGGAGALAEAIAGAVARSSLDAEWGEENRRAYETHFSIPAFGQRWLDLISEAVAIRRVSLRR